MIITGGVISMLLYILFKIKINALLPLLFFINILIYLLYFSFLLLNNKRYPFEDIVVPIDGYYYRRIDAVLFSYEGKNYKRPIKSFSKEKKHINIMNDCELKLRIRKCNKNIYYLESMDIVRKSN